MAPPQATLREARSGRDDVVETRERDDAAFTRELLERLSLPIVIVTPSRALRWRNSSATRFIAEAGTLRIDDGQLAPVAQEQGAAFSAFIGGYRQGSREGLGRDLFLLHMPNGADSALIVRLAALPGRAASPDSPGADQVMGIFDLKGPMVQRNELARQLYGLTPAEHALCTAIAAGDDLKNCARRRQVSLHTVRAQLRSVLRKTGAARQQDIVRLWLGLGMVNCLPTAAE